MKDIINAFINDKNIAVVGVSRDKQKWGHMLFTELVKKGYTVYPINPHAEEIEGVTVYSTVAELPEDVENVIISVPASTAEHILEEIDTSKIKRVWLHKGGGEGASNTKNVELAREKGLETVYDFCPLMFFPPVGMHGVHRFFKKLFGGYPKDYAEA
jgi:hypothetical protein